MLYRKNEKRFVSLKHVSHFVRNGEIWKTYICKLSTYFFERIFILIIVTNFPSCVFRVLFFSLLAKNSDCSCLLKLVFLNTRCKNCHWAQVKDNWLNIYNTTIVSKDPREKTRISFYLTHTKFTHSLFKSHIGTEIATPFVTSRFFTYKAQAYIPLFSPFRDILGRTIHDSRHGFPELSDLASRKSGFIWSSILWLSIRWETFKHEIYSLWYQ